MVVQSTILRLDRLLDMKQKTKTYKMPNMGCLLGIAYQTEYASLEATLKSEGLEISAPEYLVLRVIFNHEGLQLCEIGEILGKDKGAISRCVGSLVRKQLVRTESVSHKCLRAYTSSKGEELKPKILNVAVMRQSELAKKLSKDEMQQLKIILTKIINPK